MKVLAIFDIDGTLADYSAYTLKHQTWEEYSTHDNLVSLSPIPEVVEICQQIQDNSDAQVLFITGRGEHLRVPTLQWLRKHGLLKSHPPLIMHDNLSSRNFPKYKEHVLRGLLTRHREVPDLVVVYDDDRMTLNRLSQYLVTVRIPFTVFLVSKANKYAPVYLTEYASNERPAHRRIDPDPIIENVTVEDGEGDLMSEEAVRHEPYNG